MEVGVSVWSSCILSGRDKGVIKLHFVVKMGVRASGWATFHGGGSMRADSCASWWRRILAVDEDGHAAFYKR